MHRSLYLESDLLISTHDCDRDDVSSSNVERSVEYILGVRDFFLTYLHQHVTLLNSAACRRRVVRDLRHHCPRTFQLFRRGRYIADPDPAVSGFAETDKVAA